MRLQFVEQLRACYFIPVGAPNSLTGLRFVNPKRVCAGGTGSETVFSATSRDNDPKPTRTDG